MTNDSQTPFDDAAGNQFLSWFANKGGFPAFVNHIDAAGFDFDTATPIPSPGITVIDAGSDISGARLPHQHNGTLTVVINGTGSRKVIYPHTLEEAIGAHGVGSSISIAPSSVNLFLKVTNVLWYLF